ncbi:MAG TPA: ABC transporter permease [Flavobacteriales bacterium]|nr:ABC transporter permease [Flavobacteriales bacterium]
MSRLIGIEFYKIKHHKLSKVLFLAYFVLLSAIALIAAIKINIGKISIHLAEQGIFNFPYIWHFNTWVADFLTFFLAIIVVSMVTNEYNYRTVKQNLIDGLTKKEFVLSKFYFLVVLALTATLYVFVMSLILGLIYSDFTSPGIIFKDVYFLAVFFLKLLGIFTFIMFLGFLFRKSAIALGFFFIWLIVESILYALLRWQFFDKTTADQISQFFPYASFKNLLPEPITRLSAAKNIGKQIGEHIDKFEGVPLMNFIIVAVWIIIFVFLSYKLLKRRDL